MPGGIDEYLRRRAALDAAQPAGVVNLGESAKQDSAPDGSGNGAGNAKKESTKRLSSQEERELTKKMNALERKMGKLDEQATKLNAEMAEVAGAGDIDTAKLTELDSKLKEVTSQREELEMEWLELGEKLEG